MEIEEETGTRAWCAGSWRAESRRAAPWRRDLDVLDAYDTDRVCSERLADDLVNELLRGPRRRLRRYSFTAATTR